jgi:hypothetical protein
MDWLDQHQPRAFGDLATRDCSDLPDRAVNRRAQRMLHFHCLYHRQSLSAAHACPLLHSTASTLPCIGAAITPSP